MKRRNFLKPAHSDRHPRQHARAPARPWRRQPITNRSWSIFFCAAASMAANLVVPLGDKDHEYYSIMRPTLAIPDTGNGCSPADRC